MTTQEETHMDILDRLIRESLRWGRTDYEATLMVGVEAARLGLSPTQTYERVRQISTQEAA